MFGLFKNRQEKQRREAHELALKQSLKDKLSSYQERLLTGESEDTDFTEITLDGNKVQVRKNSITIHDLTSNTFFARAEA